MRAVQLAVTGRLSRVTRFLFIFSVGLVCGFGSLYAQNSQISGRILDPSQASVNSATVSLTRVDTGDHREAASSAEGYYSFPLLVPGVYDLTVQKDGFQSQTHKGVKVETGQISSVDVTLARRSLAVCQRRRNCGAVQADSAAVSQVVTSQTMYGHATGRPAVVPIGPPQWLRSTERHRLKFYLCHCRRPGKQHQLLH